MLAPRDALAAIGQLADTEIDIAAAALQLARIDAPDRDWQAVEAHLSELARDAVGLAAEIRPGDVASRVAALAGLITGHHRYRGDTDHYDNMDNANLIRVVERRRGLPVALGIIWLHCARAAGWGVHGVDFPGHFLIAFEMDATGRRHSPSTAHQMIVDVFAGGIPLEPDDLRTLLKHVAGRDSELQPGALQPMSARRVLLRLQENIRIRRLRGADLEGALDCTENMLRIAPDNAALWREAALLHEQHGSLAAAVACWERFLALVPKHAASDDARAAITRLRKSLN